MAEAIDIRELNIRIEQQSQFVTNLVMGMNKVIVGQKHLVDCLLIGLLSDGHILLEGVPGLAKTLAIKTLSQLISSDYSRIQFTPDLLPADSSARRHPVRRASAAVRRRTHPTGAARRRTFRDGRSRRRAPRLRAARRHSVRRPRHPKRTAQPARCNVQHRHGTS